MALYYWQSHCHAYLCKRGGVQMVFTSTVSALFLGRLSAAITCSRTQPTPLHNHPDWPSNPRLRLCIRLSSYLPKREKRHVDLASLARVRRPGGLETLTPGKVNKHHLAEAVELRNEEGRATMV